MNYCGTRHGISNLPNGTQRKETLQDQRDLIFSLDPTKKNKSDYRRKKQITWTLILFFSQNNIYISELFRKSSSSQQNDCNSIRFPSYTSCIPSHFLACRSPADGSSIGWQCSGASFWCWSPQGSMWYRWQKQSHRINAFYKMGRTGTKE